MARQNINIGSVANDGTGDTIRAGGAKINENFIELYSITTSLSEAVVSYDYEDLSNKPSLGTSSSLDTGNSEGEVPTLGVGGLISYALLPTGTTSNTVAIGDHTHAIEDVTGLQDVLDGLQTDLDAIEVGLAALNDALESL